MEVMCDQYNSTIVSALDKHAPICHVQLKPGMKKWYNNRIREERCVRRKYERLFRKTGLVVHQDMFLQQRKLVVDMITKAKSTYHTNKLEKCDPKTTI